MSALIEKALKAKADLEPLLKLAIDEQLNIIQQAKTRLAELGFSDSGKEPYRKYNIGPPKKHLRDS